MAATDKIVIILGPTASGKSDLALRLATEFGGEIVSADSLQVYRTLDIGTAKPSPSARAEIPHHLVDILDPWEPFTAADFVRLADEAVADILGRGRCPMVVGGTGLYIKALTRGLIDSPGEDQELRFELRETAQREGGEALLARLRSVDPHTAARLHPNDTFRIIRALEVYHRTGRPASSHRQEHQFAEERYRALKLGIRVERTELYRRIDERVQEMLRAGFRDEVAGLLSAGIDPELKPMKCIGYKEMVAHLAGRLTLQEAADAMARETRHYAKRQMTWFRSDMEIKWVEYPKDFDTIRAIMNDFMCKGVGYGQGTIQHSGPVS